ncbi:arylamine N-acetyltransferase [Cellulomonas sp. URHD0024]|uniref:arylamine N-acetyltransferase family protein n=1 Tax=Cellulomonas sp. URHD0024 TaxID=1302620 RepID=UPI000422000A|nr:arylamine N-acetyltransferase [Cellulomonas sp. URHD0024]
MTDDWGASRLDLDAYLDRIGLPRGGSLDEIHRAHLATIPFENLDVLLGAGVSVDLLDIERKLVHGRRGGYCYEHALLLGAALERLGYRVRRRLARIGDPAVTPRPRSHLTVWALVDDEWWLADTGYGSGLLSPVPLRDGAEATQGSGWTFRTVLLADGGWQLHERRSGHWFTHYTLPPEETFLVDVVAANWVTSTAPNSRFTAQIVVQRKDEHVAHLLTGRELVVEDPAGRQSTTTVADDELGAVLREMGLDLTPEQLAVLVARF